MFRSNLSSQTRGIKRNCKFESHQSKNKFTKQDKINGQSPLLINSLPISFCGDGDFTPITIAPSATVNLNPGCRVRLANHVIYAEQHQDFSTAPTIFQTTWNVSSLFPTLDATEFSSALKALHEYGLHTVDTAEIIGHIRSKRSIDDMGYKIIDVSDSIADPRDHKQHFANPLNYVIPIIILVLIIIIVPIILWYIRRRKRLIRDGLETTFCRRTTRVT